MCMYIYIYYICVYIYIDIYIYIHIQGLPGSQSMSRLLSDLQGQTSSPNTAASL